MMMVAYEWLNYALTSFVAKSSKLRLSGYNPVTPLSMKLGRRESVK